MRFLLIDTCTERGIIAYGDEETLLFEKYLPFGLSQSKFLLPFLETALIPFGFPPPLDAIGVTVGPGSYTGIRLGVAVAQGLAYCWKIPIIDVCSLDGFIPDASAVHYASILDARIGGFYFQKGKKNGEIQHENPQVATLEEVGDSLLEVTHLVTPFAKPLQAKLIQYYPKQNWVWEEKPPSAPALFHSIKQKFLERKGMIPPEHLNLLYLRDTEAERKKREQ